MDRLDSQFQSDNSLASWPAESNCTPLESAVEAQYVKLLYQLRGSGPGLIRRIGITSSVRGEGVTTVAAQLGQVAAGQGLRVLLVDANPEYAALHQMFGIENQHGLSELLINDNSYDTVFATSIKNLFVIPSGQVEIRAQTQCAVPVLLESLRAQFDLVVFDFPAVDGRFHAAQWLAAFQPLLLVVAKSTPASIVNQAADALTRMNLEPCGALLNHLVAD